MICSASFYSCRSRLQLSNIPLSASSPSSPVIMTRLGGTALARGLVGQATGVRPLLRLLAHATNAPAGAQAVAPAEVWLADSSPPPRTRQTGDGCLLAHGRPAKEGLPQQGPRLSRPAGQLFQHWPGPASHPEKPCNTASAAERAVCGSAGPPLARGQYAAGRGWPALPDQSGAAAIHGALDGGSGDGARTLPGFARPCQGLLTDISTFRSSRWDCWLFSLSSGSFFPGFLLTPHRKNSLLRRNCSVSLHCCDVLPHIIRSILSAAVTMVRPMRPPGKDCRPSAASATF